MLAQGPALAHLDLSGNFDFGAAEAENLAGVLGQCRELVHLNAIAMASKLSGEGRSFERRGVVKPVVFYSPAPCPACSLPCD